MKKKQVLSMLLFTTIPDEEQWNDLMENIFYSIWRKYFISRSKIWAKLQQSGSSKFGGNLRVIYKTRWFNKCRLHVAGNSLEAEFLMKFDFFSLQLTCARIQIDVSRGRLWCLCMILWFHMVAISINRISWRTWAFAFHYFFLEFVRFCLWRLQY